MVLTQTCRAARLPGAVRPQQRPPAADLPRQPVGCYQPPRRKPARPPRSARDDSAATPAAPADAGPSISTIRTETPTRGGGDATGGAAPSASSPSPGAGSTPPPAVTRSGAQFLEDLRARATAPATVNVYGKPLTKSELAALHAAVMHLYGDVRGAAAAAAGGAALKSYLLQELLLDAAATKRTPLPVVEGAMALLELLVLAGGATGAVNSTATTDDRDDPGLLASYRWQLVVGADVGGVQYIPAVEELQVSTDGASFTLGTDLDVLFTGFSGPCQWLAPGHLSYSVRQVRVELRWPKGWRRGAAAWWAWRQRQGGLGAAAAGGEDPNWGDSLAQSQTCREDPGAPAVTLPLTFFPTNELLAFSCNGRVAATRSRLTGGLILLLEVGTWESLRAGSTA